MISPNVLAPRPERQLGVSCGIVDRFLNPKLVHSDKRIRTVSFKVRPIAQIGAGRVVGKTLPIPIEHRAITFESDKVEPAIRNERLDLTQC